MPSCLSVPLASAHANVQKYLCLSSVFRCAQLLCFAYAHMCPVSLLDVSVVTGHSVCVCLLPLSCCDIVVLLHAFQSSFTYAVHSQITCGSCSVLEIDSLCVCAEERTPSNAIADDMQACKELYDMTLEIVAQKAPDIKNLAMPDPSSSS